MPLSDEELRQVDPVENLNKRPDKDSYYLSLAFVVSRRSFDPSSRCGCVLVSLDNRILSTGYNGPLKYSIDKEIPLTRPERYYHMIHAEENAIIAYSGSYQDIQGATAYVTSRPCHRCLRMLLQKGITKVCYGHNVTQVVNQEDLDAQDIMINKWVSPKSNKGRALMPRVDISQIDNMDGVIKILEEEIKYIKGIQ